MRAVSHFGPHPRASARVAQATHDDIVLEAGVRAAFGAATLVGALLVGLEWRDGIFSGGLDTGAPEKNIATPDLAPSINAETATIQSISMPRLQASALSAPRARLNIPQTITPAVEIGEDALAVHGATYVAQTPNLPRARFNGEPSEIVFAGRGAVIREATLRQSAAQMLEDFAITWQPPNVRDVSLFVASGDESVSWSFTDASPNQGGVAYQDGRVEVGTASAGIALSLDSTQVALAHVQTQDVSFWGQRQEEDYSGVILTLKF
jgi:hypothetical protein